MNSGFSLDAPSAVWWSVGMGARSPCLLVRACAAAYQRLKEPNENLGAQMVHEAAEKTGDAVGDGTNTSAVLAHFVFTGLLAMSPAEPAPST